MSPLSVEVLLALLTLGAESHTHEELMNALHLPSDDFTRSSFKILSEQLKDVKGVTLDMANKIFVKEGKELNPDFKRDSVEVFNSDIEALDFDKNENAAKVINTWVESKTNNRIKDLLKPADFDSKTRLVLVNAIYFKGSWKTKFNKDLTHTKSFQSSTGAFAMVPTMSIRKYFPYSHDYKLNAKFLQLPYEGEEMSMVFALPDERGSLPALQAKLATEYNIQDIVANMRSREVDVTIPKFKIETTLNLIDSLSKLAINSIFDERSSQLTKVTSERLYVTKAVQKAFIEVNEEGAEAAAATAFVVVVATSVGVFPSYERFYADRPFAFYLLHGDQILFTGSVNELK